MNKNTSSGRFVGYYILFTPRLKIAIETLAKEDELATAQWIRYQLNKIVKKYDEEKNNKNKE